MSIEMLLDSVSLPEKKAIRVIRWLLDNDRLILEKDQTLSWNVKK
jgi:hypothetical protein